MRTKLGTSRPLASLLRTAVLCVLLLAILGTSAELLITSHTEDALQWVPIMVMAAAILTLGWYGASGRSASLRMFQATMVLFVLAGMVWLGAHWQSKLQFKRETDPSLAGLNLFWEAMQSQSPPTLAPGVLIQLGLLGLIYTFRHPAIVSKRES